MCKILCANKTTVKLSKQAVYRVVSCYGKTICIETLCARQHTMREAGLYIKYKFTLRTLYTRLFASGRKGSVLGGIHNLMTFNSLRMH